MSHSRPTIESIEAKLARRDYPEFRAGDRVRVHAMISEGGKERVQVFEGVCIHRRHKGQRGSFTIRKVTDGVGVERVWPESSPRIHQIELVSRGRVRSAKLYYLRDRSGNAAKIRQRIGNYSTSSAPVAADADSGNPTGA